MRRIHASSVVAAGLTLAIAIAAGGCTADRAPPTAQELSDSCQQWADVGCQKDQECVGLTGTLESCIQENHDKCVAQIQQDPESCHRTGVDTLVECASSLKAESCSSYCSTIGDGEFTFCYEPCAYVCP